MRRAALAARDGSVLFSIVYSTALSMSSGVGTGTAGLSQACSATRVSMAAAPVTTSRDRCQRAAHARQAPGGRDAGADVAEGDGVTAASAVVAGAAPGIARSPAGGALGRNGAPPAGAGATGRPERL